LTADTAQAWSKTRITYDRSAKTVRDAWVGAAHAIYEWAKAERLIPNNPFAAVSVTVPQLLKLVNYEHHSLRRTYARLKYFF
jgi:hypothetical protein